MRVPESLNNGFSTARKGASDGASVMEGMMEVKMEAKMSQDIQQSLPIEEAPEKQRAFAHVIASVPDWLRDQLREYAAGTMPDASWEDVLVLVLATGVGALNSMKRAGHASAPVLENTSATTASAAQEVTWPEIMCRSILGRIAQVGGPVVMNLLEVAELVPEISCNLSNRNIGFKLASLSRTGPAFGLRIENLGRGPGQPLHQYRLSAVDD